MIFFQKINNFLKDHSNLILRLCIGFVYIWFGLLKAFNTGPIDDLVDQTIQFIHLPNFSMYLGFWELLIGLCFLFRKSIFIGIGLFFLQIPGTFLPLVLFPEVCFIHFPFILSLEGQYIFKNLILIGAVIQVYVNQLKNTD